MKLISLSRFAHVCALSALLAACGGGGGGGSAEPPPTPPVPVQPVVSLHAGVLKSTGVANGPVASAQFSAPRGVAQDAAGNVFLIDGASVRKISVDGVVSTVAGAAAADGFADGTGNDARFRMPVDLVLDATGSLYVADAGNQVIRKISPTGAVITVAGVAGQAGGQDGPAGTGLLEAPLALALAPDGSLFIASRNAIRRMAPDGTLSTFAGQSGWTGVSVIGDAAQARFNALSGIAVDGAGNVYAAESPSFTSFSLEGRVRKFDGQGAAASFGAAGHSLSVPFPKDMQADATGNVYFISNGAMQPGPSFFTPYRFVSRIAPNGEVTNVAGDLDTRSVDGPVQQARFTDPQHLSVAPGGRIVVTETATTAVRVISNGSVTTLAGGSGEGFVDGPRLEARFNALNGIAAAPDGSLWLSDRNNHLARRIAPDGAVTSRQTPARFPENVAVSDAGTVLLADRFTTVGRSIYQLLANGEPLFYTVTGGQSGAMAFDPAGNLYLSEFNQQVIVVAPDRINKRTLAAGVAVTALAVDGSGRVAFGNGTQVGLIDAQGRVNVLAGVAQQTGTTDGVGADARFNRTSDLAWDGLGNLYVADGQQLRKVTPDGRVTTVANIASLAGVAPTAAMSGIALSGGAIYATLPQAVLKIAPLP